MSETTICQLDNVSVSFGPTPALSKISLSVLSEEITFLLGANGSGKSTALRVLAGLLSPRDGSRTVIKEHASFALSTHQSGLYRDLSLEENFALFARLRGRKGEWNSILERWGLTKVRRKRLGELSQGMRARAALCRVEIIGPTVILLDEPTSFLDEEGIERLQVMLDSLSAKEKPWAVVVATHDLNRLSRRLSRGYLLEGGEVIASTDHLEPAALLEQYRLLNR